MNSGRYRANFDRLCGNLTDYAEANCPPAPADGQRAVLAKNLSESLFLAHSTSGAKFARICHDQGLKGFHGRVEVQMGTEDRVFFYLSPFRRPNTSCGFLFSRNLEISRRQDGAASPFDSGSLLRHCVPPGQTQSPRDFLAAHEMPIPDHRHYLSLCMQSLFGDPADYVDGNHPRFPGPIGLQGGDERRWTHEVRIKGQVSLHDGHLQAVFAPRDRAESDPNIRSVFEWCLTAGVDRVLFDTPGEGDFEALKRECLEYISREIY